MKKIFENKRNTVIGVLVILAIGFAIYSLIPKHNMFVKGPSMCYPHSAAVMLQDGRVLVVGGNHAEAEIYDPKKNKFFLTGRMNYVRQRGATATLLKDGRVLIAGGEVQSKGEKQDNTIIFKGGLKQYPIAPAEIYSPKTGKFSIINSMKIPRQGHTATLLPGGNVLIIGGHAKEEFALAIEEFNPKTNEFKVISKMSNPNFLHNSVLLPNNTILIAGQPNNDNEEYFIKIYDIEKNDITNLIKAENRQSFSTTTLLNDGNVLIAGGTGSHGKDNIKNAVKYDFKTNTSTNIPGMNIGRSAHTATLLPNGKVLIIGGQTGQTIFARSASEVEIYDPKTNKFEVLKSKMTIPRFSHNAIFIDRRKVLIIGGSNQKGPITDSELYLY